MNFKNLNLSIILFTFVVCGTACAGNPEKTEYFSGLNKTFSLVINNKITRISLDSDITGWNVNCSRTRSVVWGRPWDKLKPGDAPYSEIYLIDLNAKKLITTLSVTQGPYEAVFSKDQKFVRVDDTLIDQVSGKVIGMAEDFEFTPESCPEFPGKGN